MREGACPRHAREHKTYLHYPMESHPVIQGSCLLLSWWCPNAMNKQVDDITVGMGLVSCCDDCLVCPLKLVSPQAICCQCGQRSMWDKPGTICSSLHTQRSKARNPSSGPCATTRGMSARNIIPPYLTSAARLLASIHCLTGAGIVEPRKHQVGGPFKQTHD